jgi:hypothetical protein
MEMEFILWLIVVVVIAIIIAVQLIYKKLKAKRLSNAVSLRIKIAHHRLGSKHTFECRRQPNSEKRRDYEDR